MAVFSHLQVLLYFCSMEVFNITLPTSWDEMTDKQLLMVYGLFARDLSAAEVKTLCLMKWNHLKLLATLPDKRSIIKREKEQGKEVVQQEVLFLRPKPPRLPG